MKITSSRYRTIHCKIWNDDKFPLLSAEGKLVFFLLLTTTFSSPFGAYKAGKAALEEESRMDAKGFAKGFAECLSNGLAKYDETARVVYLPNFLKYNPPANPNVVKSWGKIFNELPKSGLDLEIYCAILNCCDGMAKGFREAFSKAFAEPEAKGMRIQEQEQEQNKLPLVKQARPTDSHGKENCGNEGAERFDTFWEEYPRKVNKKKAQEIWTRKKCWNGEFDTIMAKLTEFKQSDQWQRDDGRYIPHPATWLNAERWNDEISCPMRGQKAGGLTFE